MPHPPEACYGSPLHCYICNEDEPVSGFLVCFECNHTFVTADELLAEHNKILESLDMSPEKDVSQIFCCPMCLHNF